MGNRAHCHQMVLGDAVCVCTWVCVSARMPTLGMGPLFHTIHESIPGRVKS